LHSFDLDSGAPLRFGIEMLPAVSKRFNVRIVLIICSLLVIPIGAPSKSYAIEGGYSSPALVGATVALLNSETTTLPFCSGMLLDENLIATAAHCVIDASGNVRSNIWISPAGADLSTSPKLTPAAQVFTVSGWKNSSDSVISDDIAFVTSKNSLGKPIFSKILSTSEARALYGQSVILSGYGRKGALQAASQKPLFLQQRVLDWVIPTFPFGTYTHVVATDTETPCPGDSGGPIFKEEGGKYFAVGVIAGGNGCTTVSRKEEREVGFIISAFNSIYQNALASIKAAPYTPQSIETIESNGQVRVSWPEVANRLLTSTTAYEVIDGSKKVLCRAEQIAIFRNARECSFTLSAQSVGPINLVPVGIKSNGLPIDLKLDSAITRIKSDAADRAAADAKAAADRAAADAKAAIRMRTSITCTKGKVIRKVSGANPKCPNGFKKK